MRPRKRATVFNWRRGGDSNPRWTCAHTTFPRLHHRPLGHPSSSFAVCLASGARGGTRTLTPSRATDFESAAAAITPLWPARGAGEGNRTLVASLEGWSSAIELRPLRKRTAHSIAYFLHVVQVPATFFFSRKIAFEVNSASARQPKLPGRNGCDAVGLALQAIGMGVLLPITGGNNRRVAPNSRNAQATMRCRRCLAPTATLRTTFTLRYSVLYHPVGAFCGRTWLREGAVGNAKFQRFGLAASPERYLMWSCSRCLTARVVPSCDWSRLASRLESPCFATGVALPRDWSRLASRPESPWLATGVALPCDRSRLAARPESPEQASKEVKIAVSARLSRPQEPSLSAYLQPVFLIRPQSRLRPFNCDAWVRFAILWICARFPAATRRRSNANARAPTRGMPGGGDARNALNGLAGGG